MDEFENIWGFTTFGGDSLPMVAALETIEQMNIIMLLGTSGIMGKASRRY